MLKNKIALITGAGRGIGRAIAIALAKEGAEVVINYNGSEERAKEVKQTIEENGGKASIYKCNVSDFAACEAMIKCHCTRICRHRDDRSTLRRNQGKCM